MGQAMPSCGSSVEWAIQARDEIAYYTCSMHPSVQAQEPGTCPICSMGLVPVTREEQETGVIHVDARRRQLIGVRTAVVGRQAIMPLRRLLGLVRPSQFAQLECPSERETRVSFAPRP